MVVKVAHHEVVRAATARHHEEDGFVTGRYHEKMELRRPWCYKEVGGVGRVVGRQDVGWNVCPEQQARDAWWLFPAQGQLEVDVAGRKPSGQSRSGRHHRRIHVGS